MKLGRNDPCHCGSGKKYKYCHYEADKAAEAQALREAAEARAAAHAAEASDDDETLDKDASKQRNREGSHFLRDSSRGGHAQTGSVPNRTPRSTRGAQRGG